MADKIYFNGFNAKQSKYGIKLSGKVEKIIEELKKHQNSKGYITIEILSRREPDKYGNTHTVVVDTWEPQQQTRQQTQQQNVASVNKTDLEDTTSDLPF